MTVLCHTRYHIRGPKATLKEPIFDGPGGKAKLRFA